MSDMSVLEKTVCVQLNVSIWSGLRRLTVEDLGDGAGELPPEDLASLGSLKLCDPKRLRRLRKLKRAAERSLQRRCVRFLGGYATDEKNVAVLVKEVEAHQQPFEAEADALVKDLPTLISHWVAEHPHWKDAIERRLPNAAYVRGRTQFAYQFFRVGPPAQDPADAANTGFCQATGGLVGQLFLEIERAAQQAYKKCYAGKDSVGQKALGPIRTIEKKLLSLRYLDCRCVPIIDRVGLVLRALPKHGPVEGVHLSSVVGLLHLLGNADLLKTHGAMVLRPDSAVLDQVADADELPLFAPDNARADVPVGPPDSSNRSRDEMDTTVNAPTPTVRERRDTVRRVAAGWF